MQRDRGLTEMLNNKDILITGGTGSFGKKCVAVILNRYKPRRLIIFSRDEAKQDEMRQVFSPEKFSCLRYFIGDVRDKGRLRWAFKEVNYIIHAAALKHVPAAEYNPFEAVQTNIIGAQNVIEVAVQSNVQKVLALSTDKAVNPINLYGATKLCLEKLFVAANLYAGKGTKLSVVRYGNVVASRGSVIPLFLKQKENNKLYITDLKMTRFWITLEQGVDFVLFCLENMHGGEIFVPKIPSMKIIDLAKAMAPECEIEVIGIRPGEKLNEVLISKDESRYARDNGKFFVIQPSIIYWEYRTWNGSPVPQGYEYTSDNNSEWLTSKQLREMLKDNPVGS